MKVTHLGEFEEVVLLAVAIRAGDAYGAVVVGELERQLDRSVNLGAVYSVTVYGRQALKQVRQLRNQMWNAILQTSRP